MTYKIIATMNTAITGSVVSISASNFNEEIATKEGPVFLLVWHPGHYGAKKMNADLPSLATQFPQIQFAENNATQSPIKRLLDSSATPPFCVMFVDGKESKRLVGFSTTKNLVSTFGLNSLN